MRLSLAAFLAVLPIAAFAAGSDDPEPPTPTETTTKCEEGQVYDDKAKACVVPEESSLNDDQRFDAVRELAWAGRPEEALVVLSSMTEGPTDRVLTYQGFALRKAGRIEEGIAAYQAAIAQNPGNILARSYFGQLLVEMNEPEAASLQLAAIRAAGGTGTWAETSLERAIRTGATYSF